MDGYVEETCISPLEASFESAGGIWFVYALPVGVGAWLLLYLCCGCTKIIPRHRERRHAKRTNAAYVAGDAAAAGYMGWQARSMMNQPLIQQSQTPRAGAVASDPWATDQLSGGRLNHHLHRVYFDGCNTPAFPLIMDERVPPQLKHFCRAAEYQEHAGQCMVAANWPAYTQWLYGVVLAICPALGHHMMNLMKLRRLKRLRELHEAYDQAMLVQTRARALGNCMIFGYSRDGAAAWIDFFLPHTSVVSHCRHASCS